MTSAEWHALPASEQARVVLRELVAYGDTHHWDIHSDLRGWLHGHAALALAALDAAPSSADLGGSDPDAVRGRQESA